MIIKKFIPALNILVDYDDDKNLYWNPNTQKWVQRIRNNKGKAIGLSKGKSIGHAKGKSIGHAKDKALGKALEKIDSEHQYVWYDIPEITNYTPDVVERINLFLYITERKYNIGKYKRFLQQKEEFFNGELTPSPSNSLAYFSIRHQELILTKRFYREILELLTTNGYLVARKQRLDAYKNNGYVNNIAEERYIHLFEPTDKLAGVRQQAKHVEYKKVDNSIRAYIGQLEQCLGDYHAVYKRFYSLKINVDADECLGFYKQKYTAYKQQKQLTGKTFISEEEYLETYTTAMGMVSEWNAGHKYTKASGFTVDKFAQRVHSPFTYLPSYFTGKTGLCVEIDLMQSQMTCLAHLLNTSIGENTFSDSIDNGIDVYQLLADHMGLPNRQAGKQQMFQIIFGGGSNALLPFAELWPDAAAFIQHLYTHPSNELKEFYRLQGKPMKPYSEVAFRLQNIETRIFRRIWKELLLHKGRIVFITRHDSICVRPEQESMAYDTIESILYDMLSCRFELKINKLI